METSFCNNFTRYFQWTIDKKNHYLKEEMKYKGTSNIRSNADPQKCTAGSFINL